MADGTVSGVPQDPANPGGWSEETENNRGESSQNVTWAVMKAVAHRGVLSL